MAVKTTKIQYNQDVDFRGKADIEGKLTCGSDVEVDGKVKINSAKDLVTKDGTSIGGGDDIFEISLSRLGDEMKTTLTADEIAKYKASSLVFIRDDEGMGSISLLRSDGGDAQVGYSNHSLFTFLGNLTDNVYSIQIELIDLRKYALKTDLNAKQATLYRHTVTFSESGLGYTNRFTAYSEKNTPIDSIQDLITVFGNTELMCTGTIEAGSNPCVGINVGTTADTILFLGLAGATQKLSAWYSTDPQSTLTITDSVTAM